MGKILQYLFCFKFFLLGSLQATYAQSNEINPLEQNSPRENYPSVTFSFPNINKVPYFYDERKLDQINKLEKKKDWIKMYKALSDYVFQFGIQNFYKDTYLLWRLAKLTELYGNQQDAINLYKLVLKHHREGFDIRKVELYYDSIKQEDKNLYVPLDYYYELVEYRKEVDTLRPPRGVHLNMGQLINSKSSDYGPALSINDDVMLFTSKRNIIEKDFKTFENEDLFFSRKYGDYWDVSAPLEDINSQFNEGSACLSKDGRSLYFVRCYSPDSFGNCDLFSAELLSDSTWGNIKNLGPNINSKTWDSHPSLSHTGDTLYFASDRIGGFGLSDIYFTHKQKDGSWSPAKNVGPVVNTRKNEVSPFYHPVYNILYFSSNGHLLNFGEFDIFKSYRLDNSWSEPKNIGPLVNDDGSEFYFTIDSRSSYLFYAKSEKEQMANMDLYSFPLPMEAQPDATTKITGSLMNSETGKPFKSGIVSIIDLDNGIEVAPKFLREDGSFEFDLINNQNYLLVIQGEEFFRIEEIFFLEDEMEFHKYTESISSKIKFESIEFDNGKADLKPAMYGDLYKVADFLLDNPDFKLKISGHTDSDGSKELNIELSNERAFAIKDFLVNFGSVPESRIEAQGYGSTRPIVEENTEDDKRLNRRVEFEIIRPSKQELELMQKEVEDEKNEW